METLDVAQVLQQQSEKQMGTTTASYGILLRKLETADEMNDDELIFYLRSLRHCAADLGKQHEPLITVILYIHWTKRAANVIKEYQSLILTLISAQTHYLSRCVECIVDELSMYAKSRDKRKRSRVSYDSPVAKNAVLQSFNYLHQLLQAIVKMVPMTPIVLVPLVRQYFPFIKLDCFIIENYVRNILRMCTYMPSSRCELLRLVIEKSIGIDVIAPREQVLQAEDVVEEESSRDEELFAIDDVGKTIANEQSDMNHVEGHKLDCIMDLLFTYIHQTCYQSDSLGSVSLNGANTKSLFNDLIQIFDAVLLTTHASCHVQFIMFYICSFRTSVAESFLEHLWRKSTNPNVETVFRQAAVAYMSSFLARARYLKVDELVWVYLERMSEWVHSYIKEASYVSLRPDVRHHGAFYSVCQALFYVFVFRYKSLLRLPNGTTMAKSLGLANVVSSRLNPLRVCHPTIVDNFASVARATHIAFCDTIIEHNRRSMLPEVGSEEWSGEGLSGQANPLNLYFPFDPYVLTKSSSHLSGLYQDYEGPVMADTSTEEKDESSEFNEGMEFDEVCMSPTRKILVGSLGCSVEDNYMDFFKYGRSPGFNRKY